MELLELLYTLTFPFLYSKVFRTMVLHPGAQEREPGYELSLWVRRGERDGEAIGRTFPLPLNQDDINWIRQANKEAEKANQPDWFYCTRCKKAYPRTEYGYFYFAGNYCKQCKVDDPAHFKMACRETYN